MEFLDKYIKKRKFLVGDNLTVADIHLMSLVNNIFRFVLKPKKRKKLKHIAEYLEELVKHDNLKEHVREFNFTDEKFNLLKFDFEEMKKEAAEKKR